MVWPFRPHTRSRRVHGIAAILLLMQGSAGFAAAMPGAQAGEEYAVVVSFDVPVDNLSFDDLRQIFLFRKRYWRTSRPVTILFFASQLETGTFLLDEVYRMDYASMRLAILQKLYSADLDLAPKVVANEKVAVQFVGSGKGLISVVPWSAVKEEEVKVLSIDGKQPGEEGYRLRR